jgi:hypothetical protein
MPTLLSRLVLADMSTPHKTRSHGHSRPAYPPPLFPLLASFSALGLTCFTKDLSDE